MSPQGSNLLQTTLTGHSNITAYTITQSFDRFGTVIDLTVAHEPSLSLDNAGDNRTLNYFGDSMDCFLAAKQVSATSSEWRARLQYITEESKVRQDSPEAPIKFMTMTAREKALFELNVGTGGFGGTAKDSLDYIPLIKEGDDFGRNGWRMKEILQTLSSKLTGAYGIKTNVPDFDVRELSVNSSYFNAIDTLLEPYEVRYHVSGSTIYAVSYGGTLGDLYSGFLRIKTASSISSREAAVPDPRIYRFYGGDGFFDPDRYTGKKAVSSISSNSTYTMGSSVFTGGNGADPSTPFYSYGAPFVFTTENEEEKVVSPESFPSIQEELNTLLSFSKKDTTEAQLTAQFKTVTTQVFSRSFFDEPAEKVWSYQVNYLDTVDGTDLTIGSKIVNSETYEYWDYGVTISYFYETPRLSSIYSVSEGAYRPCYAKLENALLPHKSANDSEHSIQKSLMPKALTFLYRRFAESTDDKHIEGDLVWEKTYIWSPVLIKPGNMKSRLTEPDDGVEFSFQDVIFPPEWTTYDPSTAALSDLMVPECLVEVEEVRYTRLGKYGYSKITTVKKLEDATGIVRTSTKTETVKGRVPNEPLLPRKAPLLYTILDGNGTNRTPPYEVQAPIIVDGGDLQALAEHSYEVLRRPKADLSLTMKSEIYASVGWKFILDGDRIETSDNVLDNLPSHKVGVISSYIVDRTYDDVTTSITVDLY